MKVGILVTNIGNFGQKGFYNSQEIGLGKELAGRGHLVYVYKCVSLNEDFRCEQLRDNLVLNFLPSKQIGSNALIDTGRLDSSLDVLVCFSDIQLSVNKVCKWAKHNQIVFIPYIGTIESKSKNLIAKFIMDINANRVFSLYKKTGALVKTRAIQNSLQSKGVKKTVVSPVGIDFELLKSDFEEYDVDDLKRKYGFKSTEQIVLLIGRIESDRNPLDAVDVFGRIHSLNSNYRLLVVGKGSLITELKSKIERYGLDNCTSYINQLPNNEMWEIYRISSCLITFSRSEIFGMSILEAMYYKVPVYAICAPGPNDIIVNGVTGYLFETVEKMKNEIQLDVPDVLRIEAHNRIIHDFSWSITASIIENYV